MNCPVCGKAMQEGKVVYNPIVCLHFLPLVCSFLYVMTVNGIEKQGGIALDGPNNLGPLKSDGTLPAYICRECRKIVVEY